MRHLYHTITLGDPDLPFQAGGRGPDEPTWYFDVPEQFEKALNELVGYDLDFTQDTAAALPEGELVSDAAEFIDYVRMQVMP